MEVDDTEIKNTYTKWLEDGRFFLLPNAIFTLGLSPGEMTLYAYLIFCEDRKTHQWLEREGYQVKWSANRKHITFITPEGYRCRNTSLHDETFLKDNLEYLFL